VIVLDEHLEDERIIASLARWYRGQIRLITSLRPGTVIKDEAIPDLLRRERQPTFVTANVSDFWRVASPDPGYCIVAAHLSSSGAEHVSVLVRRLFGRREFATKATRMGKIVRVSTRGCDFYAASGEIQSILWTNR
jgi:hypothetical protein